jgi:hypothetical protein
MQILAYILQSFYRSHKTFLLFVTFEFVTSATMTLLFFWVLKLCRFIMGYCLHLRGYIPEDGAVFFSETLVSRVSTHVHCIKAQKNIIRCFDLQSLFVRFRSFDSLSTKAFVKQSRYTPWRRLGGEEV